MQRNRGREIHCSHQSFYCIVTHLSAEAKCTWWLLPVCSSYGRPSLIIPLSVAMVEANKQSWTSSSSSSFSSVWHGLIPIWPRHRDGLHGCQWNQRRAVSGSQRGGSWDLHDCFQEPLGSGKSQLVTETSSHSARLLAENRMWLGDFSLSKTAVWSWWSVESWQCRTEGLILDLLKQHVSLTVSPGHHGREFLLLLSISKHTAILRQ